MIVLKLIIIVIMFCFTRSAYSFYSPVVENFTDYLRILQFFPLFQPNKNVVKLIQKFEVFVCNPSRIVKKVLKYGGKEKKINVLFLIKTPYTRMSNQQKSPKGHPANSPSIPYGGKKHTCFCTCSFVPVCSFVPGFRKSSPGTSKEHSI